MNYHEAPLVGELFPNLPPASPGRQPVLKLFCTRANYGASVKQRWHGWALRDALDNWEEFEEHRAVFAAWCEHYRRDPQMYVGAKAHNPEGTLTSMVWVMQAAIEPDKSCCYPCLDFEEHFQTVFIRRGLMMYLTLLLQEAESTSPRPAPHLASEAKRGEGEVVSAPVPL